MFTLQTGEFVSPEMNEASKARTLAHVLLLDWGTALLVLICSLIAFSTPLRHPEHLLAYAQDDFYYYLIVARNLAHGLGSTFDGTTPTNGYHPLYLLLLVGVCKFSSNLTSVYKALWPLDVVSTLGIFLATRALMAKHIRNGWLTNALALAIAYLSFWRVCQQMEVTLTLPLGFCLLLLVDRRPEEMTARRSAGVGLLGAILTLSRLDSALLVLLCVGAALGIREYRRTLTVRKLLAFSCAYLPLILAYLAVNWHFFHRLTPISGSAKQMTETHYPHLWALRGSLSSQATLMFLATFAAAALLPMLWHRMRVELRVIAIAALSFPVVHWGLNLTLSDWMMWPWYRYSLIYSVAVVLLLAGMFVPERLPAWVTRFAAPVLLLGMMAAFATAKYTLDGIMLDIAEASEHLQAFAATHPGRYAMGDRAGMAAYLNPNPTVQLEGLMMDDRYLEHVRDFDPLRDVMKAYHVDYYVVFDWKQAKRWPKRCLEAREPAQAGPDSPYMDATFCEAPVDSFRTTHGRTVVYDLHHQPVDF